MSQLDPEALTTLERALDPVHPERQRDRFEVIAYGEISAVLVPAGRDDIVLKRQSGFVSAREQATYAKLVRSYVDAVEERGIAVAETDIVPVTLEDGRRSVYLVQPRLDEARLCHRLLRGRSDQEIFELLDRVFSVLVAFYAKNRGASLEVALDAQLSNWALDARDELVFFDVSTPFLRRDGAHLIDEKIITRSMPEPLRTALRLLFAKQVLDRYYALDQVFTDILANFIKEGRADMVPRAVAWTNGWVRDHAVDLPRFDADRVRRYYDEDARIWELLAVSRRAGRFVTTRILRRRYDFLLPGKVKRR